MQILLQVGAINVVELKRAVNNALAHVMEIMVNFVISHAQKQNTLQLPITTVL